MKIYGYEKCGTCRKAWKWLDENSIEYEKSAIRDTPPTKKELESMLEAYEGNVKKLFNTSGQDYRNGAWKDKLSKLSRDEIIDALASNGNLIKRPFVVVDGVGRSVGFKPEVWEELYHAGSDSKQDSEKVDLK